MLELSVGIVTSSRGMPLASSLGCMRCRMFVSFLQSPLTPVSLGCALPAPFYIHRAQIGVAVPKYQMEQVREALISDSRIRFASVSDSGAGAAVDGGDDDDTSKGSPGLSFRRRVPSSSNLQFGKAVFDGLVAGVAATTTVITKTASVTTDAVKGVGRGIGAAGSAVSLAVAAVVAGGGRAGGCQSGVPAPTEVRTPCSRRC